MDLQRYEGHFEVKKKTTQSWSGVEVVDYFREYFDIPDKGAFGYTFWLKQVKEANCSLEQARRLIQIMKSVESWLKGKGETMHGGKWMFNRFRGEIKEMGVDRFISSRS